MTKGRSPLSSGAQPASCHPSGNRSRRLLGCLVTGVLVLVLSVVGMLPAATAFVPQGGYGQASDFPEDLRTLSDLGDIPTIGLEPGEAAFNRVALVERRAGKTLLRDPFSSTVWREVTAEEAELAGGSTYVVEAFGRIPERTLTLIFAHGPDPRYTPEILDLLAKEGMPATFFTVGENIIKHPDVFRRLVREGHLVGNHTMSHGDFRVQDDGFNRQQIIGTDRVMRAVDNYESRLFLIPAGGPESRTLALLHAQHLGYLPLNQDLDMRDRGSEPGSTAAVPELDGKGRIVLLNAGGGPTATLEMLTQLISRAMAQGYTFTSLEPLLPSPFVPKHGVEASVEDNLAMAALTSYFFTPNMLLQHWLPWFGIGSLAILTLLFLGRGGLRNGLGRDSRQRERQGHRRPGGRAL